MKTPTKVLEAPPALVTTTSPAPADMLEVTQVREEGPELTKEQALPFTVTVGETKPDPDIVTFVPPAVEPEDG